MTTVAVIMPAYNARAYIGEALDSLLQQTRPPDEIIVVDDGSADDTARICETHPAPVTVIRQANAGHVIARNVGVAHARSDLIALLDADDVSAPQRLELQAAALSQDPSLVACFSGHWVMDSRGRQLGSYQGIPERAQLPPESFAATVQVHPITMMYRRRLAADVHFPVGLKIGEDMIFSALLRRRGPVSILPDVLFGYRRHESQMTAHTTDIYGLKMRLAWLQANYLSVWPDLDIAKWEELAWQAVASNLQEHYWARRKSAFYDLRDSLRDNWPADLPAPPEFGLRWYPDWLWSLKGVVDRKLLGRR
jgi:glycosyltransferase involved in cell wall biosynthesis